MPLYAATLNRPGFLPESADPAPLFQDCNEAWSFLRGLHDDHWDCPHFDEAEALFDTQITYEPGELISPCGEVYSVAIPDLPQYRYELRWLGESEGIVFYADESPGEVLELISRHDGTRLHLARLFPYTATLDAVLLLGDWELLEG